MICGSCSAKIMTGTKFCARCGMKVSNKNDDRIYDPDVIQEKLYKSSLVLTEHKKARSYLIEDTIEREEPKGPIRFTGVSIKKGIKNIGMLLKHPKQLIPVLVLCLIWLVMALLYSFDINTGIVKVISYATFAQGGMSRGVLGAVGGIIGKAVFAFFIHSIIKALFYAKKQRKEKGQGFFKSLKTGLALNSLPALGRFLAGMGSALILFNFMTGDMSYLNSIIGIITFILALKTLYQKSGFIWGLLLSFSSKPNKGKPPDIKGTLKMITGFAIGSLVGFALVYLNIKDLAYICGAVLILSGIVLVISGRSGRKAVRT